MQNEIIEACNEILLQKVVRKVNDARCFAILADESTDNSVTEQLSMSARYVDLESMTINENFLQFVPVEDVTGKGIANSIQETLRRIGLDLRYLRGQSYDGAAAMSGEFNGVQAHIRNEHPTPLYVHCAAHSLNLTVSHACEIACIRNCIGTLEKVYLFFNTPKRQAVLRRAIETSTPETNRPRLKRHCETRWIERQDAVAAFIELQEAVFLALEEIKDWRDRSTSSEACQLLLAIKQAEFYISLLCLKTILTICGTGE